MISSSNIQYDILQIIWNTCWMIMTRIVSLQSWQITYLAPADGDENLTLRSRWSHLHVSARLPDTEMLSICFPYFQNVHAIRKQPTSPHIRVSGFTKTRSQNDEIAFWFGMNATRNETSVWGKLSFWHFWTSWDDCSRSSWHQPSTHWSFKFHGSHRHLERSTSTHHDTMKLPYSTNEKGITTKFD